MLAEGPYLYQGRSAGELRSFRAGGLRSKAQHSEHEQQPDGDEGGDQQRTETTQAVGKKEHRA
jgi:hypothetical protein